MNLGRSLDLQYGVTEVTFPLYHTVSTIHPARSLPFDELLALLRAAVAAGRVREVPGPDGLRLFAYTNATVYERAWDAATLMARGLVLDVDGGRVAATPFPKFFNFGESAVAPPDLPFEAFEKLDGSLIIAFRHRDRWRCTTRGAFDSPQARWATGRLHRLNPDVVLDPAATYLFEAIYPENRVVVEYDHEALYLLAAYRADGTEFAAHELQPVGTALGCRVAARWPFAGLAELRAAAKVLPVSREGFVVRFTSGLRLKAKGDEYLVAHRAVTGLSPLSVWDALRTGAGLDDVRRSLPEEFWRDYDAIRDAVLRLFGEFAGEVSAAAVPFAGVTDKDVGLRLAEFPERVRRYIFPFRKANGDATQPVYRDALFRAIRPDNNRLAGYVPSSALGRVLDDT